MLVWQMGIYGNTRLEAPESPVSRFKRGFKFLIFLYVKILVELFWDALQGFRGFISKRRFSVWNLTQKGM